MKRNKKYVLILALVFGYIILQFLAWEIMFVRKTGEITELKQKLAGLSSSSTETIQKEVEALQEKKKMQVIMIVGEGTVFLLLLLFGIYKIKSSLDKEQQLNQQQQNFFLSITHELKTPITANKLQLQTIQKHQLEGEKLQEVVKNALAENERLNNLIDNLLLASRMDSGEFMLRKEKVDAGLLVEELLQRYYKNEISNKELTYEVEKGKSWELDVNAFPSLVTNLVNNAFKYSFDAKKVNVKLNCNEQRLQLSVSDEGAGIAESEKQRIFERFYRSGNEETRNSKGTGLGLYIVNYLVKNHQGKIEVRNNNPKGSIFIVDLHA